VRATAAETLFARPAWVNAFLGAVERGKVGTADVDPNRVKLLQQHPDPSIRKRAGQLFARSKFARRQDVVAAYQKALELKGDAARGKAVFKKVCSVCHRLEGVGNSVGADITSIRDRGNPTILLNILDPNREVQPRFLSYLLVTDAGRSITGMIVDESPTSVTIRRADGTSETVLRVHIEELRSTGMSFMPEGLETQVNHQGMADLLAYLNSIR
jgi:putative heme-binding domain-containing protein